MSGKLFVVSAPSGAGKTTLVNKLIYSLKVDLYKIDRIITYTTRLPKKGEVAGIDYHFITETEFKNKIGESFFLEWSNAYGAYYGSPKNIINERLLAGNSLITVLDRAGAKMVKLAYPDAILIWITPPDLETLQERLNGRSRDSQAEITYRLELAQAELELEKEQKLFSYTLVNDDFNNALQDLSGIVKKEIDHDILASEKVNELSNLVN